MSLQSEYYNSLIHSGIKGQKWGVRRFETKDGHLTPAGKERYDVYDEGGKVSKKQRKEEKKALKAAKKIQTQYKAAGERLGRADYYRAKGDEAAKQHIDNEKLLRKAAKQYDREGKVLSAELARRAADKAKERGDKARAEYDRKAEEYVSQSKYFTDKASKISTKKNVELGRKTVDEIMKSSREKGSEYARREEEWEREVADFRANGSRGSQ
jgi:uncharacterized protein (DUF3084 family)